MSFYVIANSLFDDDFYSIAEPIEAKYGNFPVCQVCGRAVGMKEWLPDRIVRLTKDNVGDFTFGSVNPFLVSAKVRHLIEGERVAGLQTFENVRVADRPGEELFLPVIERGGLLIDEIVSGFVRSPGQVCTSCRQGGSVNGFEKLIGIDGTWDGKDIFRLKQLPGTIIVSDRFARLAEEANLTNLAFKQASEYGRPWRVK